MSILLFIDGEIYVTLVDSWAYPFGRSLLTHYIKKKSSEFFFAIGS